MSAGREAPQPDHEARCAPAGQRPAAAGAGGGSAVITLAERAAPAHRGSLARRGQPAPSPGLPTDVVVARLALWLAEVAAEAALTAASRESTP